MCKRILVGGILLLLIACLGGGFAAAKKMEYSWKGLESSYDENEFSYESFWEEYNQLTRQIIAEIPDEELIEVIFDYILYNTGDTYGRETDVILQSMPEMYRMVYTIRTLQGEVYNGGYTQYFFNSEGYQVFAAIEFLHQIGAEYTAQLTEKALALMNPHKLAKEEFQHLQEERELDYGEDVSELLFELDMQFYEEHDPVDQLMIQYIREHSSLLE